MVGGLGGAARRGAIGMGIRAFGALGPKGVGQRTPLAARSTLHTSSLANRVFTSRGFSSTAIPTQGKPTGKGQESQEDKFGGHKSESWQRFGSHDYNAHARQKAHQGVIKGTRMTKDWKADLAMCAMVSEKLREHLETLKPLLENEKPDPKDVTLTTLELYNMTHQFSHLEIEKNLAEIHRTFSEEIALRDKHHKFLQDALSKIKTMMLDPDEQAKMEKMIEGLISNNLHNTNELSSNYRAIEKHLKELSHLHKDSIVDEKTKEGIEMMAKGFEKGLMALSIAFPELGATRVFLGLDLVNRLMSTVNTAQEKDLKKAHLEFDTTGRIPPFLFSYVQDYVIGKAVEKSTKVAVAAQGPSLAKDLVPVADKHLDIRDSGKAAVGHLIGELASKLTSKSLTQDKAVKWLATEVSSAIGDNICRGLLSTAQSEGEKDALNAGNLTSFEAARIHTTTEGLDKEKSLVKGLLVEATFLEAVEKKRHHFS